MGVSELNTWIRSCWEVIIGYVTWDHIKAFGNSNFLMVLVGSLAGAFAGAYAAQRIVERSKARDDLLKEIQRCDHAVMRCLQLTTQNEEAKHKVSKGGL